MYHTDKFKSGLIKLNIDLNKEQIDQFLMYYELLAETNKVMNLTAITEFDEVIEKHFLDSLSLNQVYDLKKSAEKSNFAGFGNRCRFPGNSIKNSFSVTAGDFGRCFK